MKKFIALLLLPLIALGQSIPNGAITQGQIWTPAQWNTAWQAKVDTVGGILTSPTLITPALGTPTAINLLNGVGLPLAGVTGLGSGVASFLATPSSANFAAALTGETGTGSVVFNTSPTLITPNIGAAVATALTVNTITGSTQCLHVSSSGLLSGVGADCGTPNSPGIIVLTASGDTSGVTDRANLVTAIATMAASIRLPPLFSQNAPLLRILFGPGTFYFSTGGINVLGTSLTKTQGVWFQGSGRGVTDIDYNPGTSAPLLVNQNALDVKFNDMTITGHDVNSDFLWQQEQAGLSNIQDNTFEDIEWLGSWNNIFRLTGGNNNSEWKLTRDTVSGSLNNWFYVPPAIATSISPGTTITATNNAEQVEIGDTGFFSAAVAPLAANTQYYVVAATSTTFQVSTTRGGSAVTFTGSGSPNFQTGSDQFLNFWFDKIKFDTGTSNAAWLTLNYGGNVKISQSDISGYAPSAATHCLFNLLTQIHASGVMSFSVRDSRIELSSNNACVMNSQWWRGQISWDNWDESSQAGNRTISNVYHTYTFTQSGGPTVMYSNSQLMGTHVYANQSNNFNYQNEVLYKNVTLMDNPTFANFIVMTSTANTGGYPVIECDHCRNYLVNSTVGYSEIVDTSLNWQFAQGRAVKTRSVSCQGANSDWPSTAGGFFELRLPLNAAITQFRFWKLAGGGSGAFQYTVQTTEASPTVIAGGAATPLAGANSSLAIPLYTTYGANGSTLATSTPFVMTTDLARTIKIFDSSGTRSGSFTPLFCQIDYIG